MRQPNGKVKRTEQGVDLVIERRFKGTLEDVWQSVTHPESTARWIGPWRGEPGAGNSVTLTMSFEEGAPDCAVHIDVCDAPHHLAVRTEDSSGGWFLEAHLEQAGDGEVLMRFVHHVEEPTLVGDAGPGWEYYLDRLVASRDESSMPTFGEYYPSQREYFLEQLK